MSDDRTYYRLEPTGRMIPRQRKKRNKETGQEDTQVYFEPEMREVYFSKEFVDNFSVDQFGYPIHNKIQDYTTVENYFIKFWGPILGAGPAWTFVVLMSHCYGYDEYGNRRDFTFPKLTTIAELIGAKDVGTVKKYLDVLEEHYFIYRFWRKKPDKENDSITYKLRTSIPYLPEDQLMKLSPRRQEEHAKWIQFMSNKFRMEIELPDKYDYSDEMKKIMQQGKRRPLRKLTATEIAEYNRLRRIELLKQVKESDKEIWDAIIKKLENRVSKPSLDTWFKGQFCVVDESLKMTIFAGNQFAAEWIQNRYIHLIKEAYYAIYGQELADIKVEVVELTEEQINSLPEGEDK
jgi:hypothetical protein